MPHVCSRWVKHAFKFLRTLLRVYVCHPYGVDHFQVTWLKSSVSDYLRIINDVENEETDREEEARSAPASSFLQHFFFKFQAAPEAGVFANDFVFEVEEEVVAGKLVVDDVVCKLISAVALLTMVCELGYQIGRVCGQIICLLGCKATPNCDHVHYTDL